MAGNCNGCPKRYLAGELAEKEALAIIYVPTKKELLADHLKYDTFEDVGT